MVKGGKCPSMLLTRQPVATARVQLGINAAEETERPLLA